MLQVKADKTEKVQFAILWHHSHHLTEEAQTIIYILQRTIELYCSVETELNSTDQQCCDLWMEWLSLQRWVLIDHRCVIFLIIFLSEHKHSMTIRYIKGKATQQRVTRLAGLTNYQWPWPPFNEQEEIVHIKMLHWKDANLKDREEMSSRHIKACGWLGDRDSIRQG